MASHPNGVTYCEYADCKMKDCKNLLNYLEVEEGVARTPNVWQEVEIQYCVVNNYENYKSSR